MATTWTPRAVYSPDRSASSPNRRLQFGHQVPRWNASSTGPFSRYEARERNSPFWFGKSNGGGVVSGDEWAMVRVSRQTSAGIRMVSMADGRWQMADGRWQS